MSHRPIAEQMSIRMAQEEAKRGARTGSQETSTIRAAREQQARIQEKARTQPLSAADRRALDRAEGIITGAAQRAYDSDRALADRARLMQQAGASREQVERATGVGQTVVIQSDRGVGVSSTFMDRRGRLQRYEDDFAPGAVRGRYFSLDSPAQRIQRDDRGFTYTGLVREAAFSRRVWDRAAAQQSLWGTQEFPVYGSAPVVEARSSDEVSYVTDWRDQGAVLPVSEVQPRGVRDWVRTRVERARRSVSLAFGRQEDVSEAFGAALRVDRPVEEFVPARQARRDAVDLGAELLATRGFGGALRLGRSLLPSTSRTVSWARRVLPVAGLVSADVARRGVGVVGAVQEGETVGSAVGDASLRLGLDLAAFGSGFRSVGRIVQQPRVQVSRLTVLDARQTLTARGVPAVRSRVVLDGSRRDAIGQVERVRVDQQLLRDASGRTTGQVFVRGGDSGSVLVRGSSGQRRFFVDGPGLRTDVLRVDSRIPRSVMLEGVEAPSGLRPVRFLTEQRGLFLSRYQTLVGSSRGLVDPMTVSRASVLQDRFSLVSTRGFGPVEVFGVRTASRTLPGGLLGSFIDRVMPRGSIRGGRGQIAIPRPAFTPETSSVVSPSVSRPRVSDIVSPSLSRPAPTVLPLSDASVRVGFAGFSAPRVFESEVFSVEPRDFGGAPRLDSVVGPAPAVLSVSPPVVESGFRGVFFSSPTPSIGVSPRVGSPARVGSVVSPVPVNIPIPQPDVSPAPGVGVGVRPAPRVIPRFNFGWSYPVPDPIGRWPLFGSFSFPAFPGPAQRGFRTAFDFRRGQDRSVLNIQSLTASLLGGKPSKRRRIPSSQFYVGTEVRF